MKRGRHGRRIGLLAAVTVLVASGVTVALASAGGSQPQRHVESGPSAAELETKVLSRCIGVWNDTGNQNNQTMIGTLSRYNDAYVSVGPAADYPDKCLVTVAFPGQPTSWQFLEDGSKRALRPWSGPTQVPTGSLPESVKDWNASLSDDGTISL